ncbi:MAG: FAD-dependent oxidoreductase [Candidatus Aminicenantales bacterium]
MERKFEAIVVGAGPAGCSCGLALARAGVKTLVVERGKFAGAKNMWGGVYYGRELEALLPEFPDKAPVERWISRHKFSFLTEDSALSAEFTSRKFSQQPSSCFSLLRSRFDRWFASKVEEAGAIVAAPLETTDLLFEGSRVTGVMAGGDELPADVVIACDGANSLLAEKAGLRSKLRPKDMKLGVKEVIELPRQILEQRFNLRGEEGVAWEFIGTFTRGIPGGGFIYTNRDTLSVGIVVQLEGLVGSKIDAGSLLEKFKRHPEVAQLIEGGSLVEYSAHLIPASGMRMMPDLYTDGMLVAGDAAAMTLVTGLVLEGANFALASGLAAAETVIEAKKEGDFSRKTLCRYTEFLTCSSVLKEMKKFRKAPRFLENPRLYTLYPEIFTELAEEVLRREGKAREKLWKVFRKSVKSRVSWKQLIRDIMKAKGAL